MYTGVFGYMAQKVFCVFFLGVENWWFPFIFELFTTILSSNDRNRAIVDLILT